MEWKFILRISPFIFLLFASIAQASLSVRDCLNEMVRRKNIQWLPLSHSSAWRGKRSSDFQSLRANSLDYWVSFNEMLAKFKNNIRISHFEGVTGSNKKFSFKSASLFCSPQILDLFQEGFVTGDPHLGNFGRIQLGTQSFVSLIDLDDSGWGSFLLDAFKLIMITNVTWDAAHIYLNANQKFESHQKTNKGLFFSYLLGLRHENYNLPNFVIKKLKSSEEKLKKSQQKYISSFIFKEQLIRHGRKRLLDRRELSSDQEEQVSQDIGLLSNYMRDHFGRVIDIAFRIKSHGGSPNQLRIWFLIKNSVQGHNNPLLKKHYFLQEHSPQKSQLEDEETFRVFEAKTVLNPAAYGVGVQPLNFSERYRKWMELFWRQKIFPENYILQEGISGAHYWVREKLPEGLSINGAPSGISEETKFQDYANYVAYLLGEIHGQQMGTKNYEKALSNNLSAVMDFMEAATQSYLQSLN